MNWASLGASILMPAFCAGLLVLSTHIPLGQRVLERGIIFIDLAVAQVAGFGVILSANFDLPMHGLTTQFAATGAAILAALMLNSLEHRYAEIQEALIGVLFVLAATASVIALAGNPHGGEHLRDLLVGQILFVTFEQLLPVALLYAVVLGLWFGYARERGTVWFYVLFAIVVTASVQLVGIYLVFASLIIPALATRLLKGKKKLVAAFAIGLLGYGFGLALSALVDLPSGAVIVWALMGFGLTSVLLNSRSA